MSEIFDIEDIRQIWDAGKIVWSSHAANRSLQKGIRREDVANAIRLGEIIEEYPSNYPNPACLIYGKAINNEVIHVVIGVDDTNTLHIITVYYPDEDKFESDLKTRRS